MPVADASVALLNAHDSSYVTAVVSLQSGTYMFGRVKPGVYTLLITKVGSKPLHGGIYHLQPGAATDAGVLVMQKATTGLNEVVITDRRHYMDVRADRTVLNISRNILASGASLYDVLGNTPGVKMSPDGNILIKAGQPALVMINGRPVSAAGQDLQAMLRSLQSAGIDRVELLPNPPAGYDANGTGGVVNIILSKGKNEGFNGSANASGGYGTYGKYSAGVSLNYRHKKFNLFGTAGESYDKRYFTIATSRMVDNTLINSNYHNIYNIRSLQYNGGVDYNIDSAHTIGLSLRGSHSRLNNGIVSSSQLSSSNHLDSAVSTLSGLRQRFGNYNYNLNYAGALGHTRQTLSADADYTHIVRSFDEHINSTLSRYAPGAGTQQTDTLRSIAPLSVNIRSVKADYLNPISKTLLLRAGAKYSYTDSHYSQVFTEDAEHASYPNALLNKDFTYKEHISSAYASLHQEAGPFNYTAGLRLEHTASDVIQLNGSLKRNYTNLFPSVQLNYKANAQHQLLLSYNYRITRPDYESLSPIYFYQDRYNYIAGYPYLVPAYGNYVQLSDTYLDKYVATLYTDLIRNFFGSQYYLQDDATKLFVNTRRNLRLADTYGARFDIPVKPAVWWDVDLNIDASYQRYQDDQGLYSQHTSDFIFDLGQNFAISKSVSALLNAHYETATYYGLSYFRPAYYASAGVSARLSQAAALALTANDIFNTNRDRYSTTYNGLNLYSFRKRESQWVKLTFTYKFGKATVKGARSHTPGNAEEVRRAVGGG